MRCGSLLKLDESARWD